MNEMGRITDEIQSVVSKVLEESLIKSMTFFNKDKKIYITGEGRSGLIGKCFGIRMMHLGFEVYIIGESILPAIQQKDVLVALSGSGESDHTKIDVKKAKEKGAVVLSFTSKTESYIGKASDCCVHIPATVRTDKEERESFQLLGSLFDQSLHVVLDALTIKLSELEKISNDEATQTHW